MNAFQGTHPLSQARGREPETHLHPPFLSRCAIPHCKWLAMARWSCTCQIDSSPASHHLQPSSLAMLHHGLSPLTFYASVVFIDLINDLDLNPLLNPSGLFLFALAGLPWSIPSAAWSAITASHMDSHDTHGLWVSSSWPAWGHLKSISRTLYMMDYMEFSVMLI